MRSVRRNNSLSAPSEGVQLFGPWNFWDFVALFMSLFISMAKRVPANKDWGPPTTTTTTDSAMAMGVVWAEPQGLDQAMGSLDPWLGYNK